MGGKPRHEQRPHAGQSGPPLTIASPLWVGEDSPQFAPYLDVTYAQPASAPAFHENQPATSGATPDVGGITPNFSDGVSSIYGLSGATVPLSQCPQGKTVCNGEIAIRQAAALGAHYVRVSLALSCTNRTPGPAFWADQSAYLLINDAYQLHITPVVQFVQNYGPDQFQLLTCPNGDNKLPFTDPTIYVDQIKDFVANMPGRVSVPYNFLIYYEIGNEMNGHDDYANYKTFFSQGALALKQKLPMALQNFRALTGGMLAPDPSPTYAGDCGLSPAPGHVRPIDIAHDAIIAAEGAGLVEANLGLSVHPYGYTTNQQYYWKNYKVKYGQTTANCQDLYQMLANWRTHADFGNLPIFLSETNWSSDPKNTVQCSGNFETPPGCSIAEYGLESSYLVDQFTWFFDRGYVGAGGSIRVMWYHGADGLGSQTRSPGGGLYLNDGNPKVFNPQPTVYASTTLDYCPRGTSLQQPFVGMSTVYSFLAHYYTGSGGACYDSHGN